MVPAKSAEQRLLFLFFFNISLFKLTDSACEDESFSRRDDPVHPARGPAVGIGIHQARVDS